MISNNLKNSTLRLSVKILYSTKHKSEGRAVDQAHKSLEYTVLASPVVSVF